MSDLERMLRDALRREGGDFEPDDQTQARVRFIERYRSRRRMFYLRTGGAIAVAAAAVVFVLPTPITEPDPQPLELASSRPKVVATIPVEASPSSTAVTPDGAVWVAMGEAGGVVQIDSETDEVLSFVETGGEPDEVAATRDHVWVSSTSGHVSALSIRTGEVILGTAMRTRQRLDIAADDDHFWAAGLTDGHLYEMTVPDADSGEDQSRHEELIEQVQEDEEAVRKLLEDPEGERDDYDMVFGQQFEGRPLTDVAAGDEGLWVLFKGEEGAGVFSLDPDDLTGGTEPIPLEVGDNADLAVGYGSVWVSTGTNGTVHRIDPTEGEITHTIEVGGEYTDLAVGADFVWAVTGGDGPSRLHQIDPDLGRLTGQPLELDGDPVDVAVGGESVWVADSEASTVLRIEPAEPHSGVTPATPEATPSPLEDDEILFVVSEDGDLYSRTVGGGLQRLTETPAFEIHPDFSWDGRKVVFERAYPAPGEMDCDRPVLRTCIERSEIVVLDLSTGIEASVTENGYAPTWGPDGQLAWMELRPDPEETPLHLVLAEETPEGLTRAGSQPVVLTGNRPLWIDHLTWFEERTINVATGTPGGPGPMRQIQLGGSVEAFPPWGADTDIGVEGSRSLVAVADTRAGALEVLSLCCPDPSGTPQGLEVGLFASAEGEKIDYDGQLQLDQLGVDVGSAAAAESLTFEAFPGWIPEADSDDRWRRAPRPEDRSWFVSDGDDLHWVSDAGQSRRIQLDDDGDYRGITVNPMLVP